MTTLAPTTLAPTTLAPTTAAPTTVAPTTIVTTAAPTTIATTVAPTTTLTTLAPTTTLTTLAPTTAVPDTDIIVDPIEIFVTLRQFLGHYYPPAPVNTALDSYFYPDPIDIVLSVEGTPGNVGIIPGSIDITMSVVCNEPDIGTVIEVDPIEIALTLSFTDYLLGSSRANFVKWSKVGDLDFTIDESNVAGERPMDWKGSVYGILKLGDRVVVYGVNGVTMMKPSGVHWGMETIYRIGLKNKGALAGDDTRHFFVDKLSQLWEVSQQGLVKLDYSEYIASMSTIILSYDIEKKLLYLCDGTYGFVYGVETKSFGKGPVNITGIYPQGGTLYVVSDGEIETPGFEICTDIYDFGTRKAKTITSIEVGSNLTQYLQASVDYRTSYSNEFKQIGWFLVNPNGKAFPRCYGVEFRFRLRSAIYEYFEVDYINIRGHIHGFSYLDNTGQWR